MSKNISSRYGRMCCLITPTVTPISLKRVWKYYYVILFSVRRGEKLQELTTKEAHLSELAIVRRPNCLHVGRQDLVQVGHALETQAFEDGRYRRDDRRVMLRQGGISKQTHEHGNRNGRIIILEAGRRRHVHQQFARVEVLLGDFYLSRKIFLFLFLKR